MTGIISTVPNTATTWDPITQIADDGLFLWDMALIIILAGLAFISSLYYIYVLSVITRGYTTLPLIMV